ncbi:unnamed protein product [Adineta steineri]|uniref:FYVE zinc finger domain-containing protein n=1 Tax=Adineta steineri TaxID=433720 RepID=A0A814AMF9_9BILA|nr:unnamed protein product [Adineta steineri]
MDNSSKNQASASASDDRFLGESMLRRITNFGLDRDSNNTKHWMPDSAGKECYDCQEKFTPWRRRHHCRVCGLLFFLQPSLSNISILHVIPTFSSNNEVHQITRQYSYRESLTQRYRNNHTHQTIPIKQCKINLENSKEVLQRCRSCKLSYQSVCKHYDNEINIDYFIQRIKLKSSIQQRIRKRI